ncbi:pre-mRNA 3'-end-processing factor FIP1-like isoform 1-T3 [Salvelinus alpinus]|uniref:pre-mRNA 3'-end-processing factor FIP1-like isoform X1 n=1 Tax=Salvelinus alpinus TaxID=8036 RepID=UPI0039FDA7B5
MSAEMDKATDASGGDEDEWLYGDESEEKAEEEAPNSAKAQPTAEEVHENGVVKQDTGQEDEESDSDSEDDDDVCVTIGDIKTGGSSQPFNAFGSTPVNLNIKAAGRTHASVGPKAKGVDLDALGSVNGIPVLEVDIESFEEKPWRKPGSDLSDYFNYGFNEDTWKTYCEKQRRLRMGYEGMNHASATKIMVHQGRSAHGDRDGALSCFRSDYSSPSNHYNSGSSSRKPSGTIDVIGGQTGTISRVEGRRRHNIEGNNIQVLSEPPSDAEPTPTKMPPFFPPNIPPPPFPPPPHNVSSAPPLIPPPRIPINVPPPGYPPGAPPPSLIPTLDSGRSGGYDGRSAPPYPPFPPGVYPPPPPGSAAASWAGVFDSAKAWEYYAQRDNERERHKERDRPRERGHEKEREREREHNPSSQVVNSEEDRHRHRDYGERGYDRHHHERSSREKEERHREKRHRDKEEGRHKSSSSSSRRRHESEEGDSHRRHKHKKVKRSREDKEPSQELSADQENQLEPTE